MDKKEVDLKIKGMHCESCEKLISMKLEDLPGAENIVIDSKTGEGRLKVDSNIENSAIIDAIKSAGYESEIKE